MNEENLYNWVFHYNPYTKNWNAIPRDHYLDYWDGTSQDKIIKSKSFSVLQEIILKTDGDPKLIKKLIKK